MSDKNTKETQINLLATGRGAGTFRMVSNTMRELLSKPYTFAELESPLALRRPTGGLNTVARPDAEGIDDSPSDGR